jgi:hypothetical protein
MLYSCVLESEGGILDGPPSSNNDQQITWECFESEQLLVMLSSVINLRKQPPFFYKLKLYLF